MKAVIFLFALVAFAAATDATTDALNEISAHPLGNVLLMSVKTSIDAGNSVEDVSRFLGQLANKEETFNVELKSDYHNERTQLETTISTLKALEKDLSNQIARLTKLISRLNGELKDAQDELKADKEALKKTQQELVDHNAHCAEAQKNLTEDIKASVSAQRAVKEALALVDKYQAAVASALIQVASEAHTGLTSFAAQLDEMKHVIINKIPESSAMVHELVVLCQAPADKAGKADRIEKLLQELESRIASNLAQERNNLEDLIKFCESRRDELQRRIIDLQRNIARLGALIESLTKQIASAETEKSEAQANLKDVTKTRVAKEKLLAERIAYYEAAIKKSDKNVEILNKLVEAYNKNVAGATAYVHNAAQTGKGF